MEGRNDLLISFDALVTVEERVSEAVEFFLKNTPNVRQYLDYYNVPHQVRYASAEGTGRADRRILPVIARIENRVLA